MTFEILEKAVKTLENTPYEGFISDLEFKEILNNDTGDKMYAAWAEDMCFTISTKGTVVFVADYKSGKAVFYRSK